MNGKLYRKILFLSCFLCVEWTSYIECLSDASIFSSWNTIWTLTGNCSVLWMHKRREKSACFSVRSRFSLAVPWKLLNFSIRFCCVIISRESIWNSKKWKYIVTVCVKIPPVTPIFQYICLIARRRFYTCIFFSQKLKYGFWTLLFFPYRFH